MENDLQLEFREEFIRASKLKAWQSFLNYGYAMGERDHIMKMVKGWQDEIDGLNAAIKAIEIGPDPYSKINRGKIKEINVSIQNLEKSLQSTVEPLKRIEKLAAEWYAEGGRQMGLAEYAKTFELKPPEEKSGETNADTQNEKDQKLAEN